MVLIACVDDDFGMMFNNRRQSQDELLRSHILQLAAGKRLWMNHYSGKQFADIDADNINTDEAFLSEAAPGEYCFVENMSPSPYEKWVEQIILYKWNRRYPGDLLFDIPLESHGWKLVQTTDFAGSSHEKITEEVYCKSGLSVGNEVVE